MFEHFSNTVVDLGRALEVLDCSNLLGNMFGLWLVSHIARLTSSEVTGA